MKTFDDETLILENFRTIKDREINFFGGLFNCLKIKFLTKSKFVSKTWVDSSSKSGLPPDFHNNRFRIMMEVMRVDDCVNVIDGKHVVNSFERANTFMKKYAGKDYKKALNGDLIFIPDTRNSEEFNFNGYINNFERVIIKHSNKVEEYRKNYPKCKTTVFFVCDESNNYIQVFNKNDLEREDEPDVYLEKFSPHKCYLDSKFIEIIKKCKADYLIWFFRFKSIFIDGKEVFHPKACIYDIKNLKINGLIYNHNLMFKVKEEIDAKDLIGGKNEFF